MTIVMNSWLLFVPSKMVFWIIIHLLMKKIIEIIFNVL